MVLNRALRSAQSWTIPLVITAIMAGVFGWNQTTAVDLRRQISRTKASQGTSVERRSVVAQSLALPETMKAERSEVEAEEGAAIERLRKEIAELKARAAARAHQVAVPRTAAARESSILKEMLPVNRWTHAGSSGPAATVETALWAASVGEVDTLAGLLSIDPVARNAVDAMMTRLPDAIRREYNTPERFVALLTAGAVPLGAAQIHQVNTTASTDALLTAVLRDANHRERVANLTLRQDGAAWKMLVPREAIDSYTAMLSGTRRTDTR